jgi:hypothetical protein
MLDRLALRFFIGADDVLKYCDALMSPEYRP